MANHPSALKEARKNVKRRIRNSAVKSRIKTLVSKVLSATTPEEAKAALIKAISAIDKAAQKGIIHKNTAARKKSRLTQRVNTMLIALAKGQEAPPKPPEEQVQSAEIK